MYLYLFTWLSQVLVVAGRILSCGMGALSYGIWVLVP